MNRKDPFVVGEYYHVYNRGVEKRTIFTNDRDHRRFLSLLYIANSNNPAHIQNSSYKNHDLFDSIIPWEEKIVEVCAYCLMPNHFHILLKEIKDSGISKYMQKVSTGYSMYFNKRYERSGSLFQGKFKSRHIDDDRYLKYLVSYIHLNPIKLIDSEWKENGIKNRIKAKDYLHKYSYSSYLDFLGQERKIEKILSKDSLPPYFNSGTSFEREVDDWLSFSQL